MNTTNRTHTSSAAARNLGKTGKSLLLAAAFALASASGLQATDFTWIGGASGVWDTEAANWDSGGGATTWVNGTANKAILPSAGGTITITEQIAHFNIDTSGTWYFYNTSGGALNPADYNLVENRHGTIYLDGSLSYGTLWKLSSNTVVFSDVAALGPSTGRRIYLDSSGSRLKFIGTESTLTREIQADGSGPNGIEVVNSDARLTLNAFFGGNNQNRTLWKWGEGTLIINGIAGGNARYLTASAGVVELQVPTSDSVAALNAPLTIQDSGTVRITGGNPPDGSIHTNGNQLAVNQAVVLSGTSSSVHGTLDLNGYNERIGSLTSTNANGILTNGNSGKGSTLFVGALNTSTAFAGNVTGNLGLTKEGTGTLTLSGDTTYTGLSVANAGTLAFTKGGNLTLTGGVGGAGTISKSNDTLTFNGVVAPGVVTFDTDGVTPLSVTPGTLTLSGNVVLSEVTRLIVGVDSLGNITNAISGAAGGTLTFADGGELYVVFEGGSAAGVTIDKSEFATAFGLTEGQLESATFNSNDGVLIYDSTTGTVAIPEPSTYALFGAIGAVGLALLRRRRRQTV